MNGFSMTAKGAKLLALGMALAAGIVWTGCDDHDDSNHAHADAGGGHTSQYPACNEIVEACHEVDTEEGPIHDCHNTAHDAKSDDACTPIRVHCLSLCAAAADAGAHDGGEPQEEHDD